MCRQPERDGAVVGAPDISEVVVLKSLCRYLRSAVFSKSSIGAVIMTFPPYCWGYWSLEECPLRWQAPGLRESRLKGWTELGTPVMEMT